MFCEQCGAKLEDDEKFCTSCGAPTDGSGPAQVSSSPQKKKVVNLAPVKSKMSGQMANKKPLMKWQMIVCEALLGVFLLTMFLPFFSVKKEVFESIKFKIVRANDMLYLLDDGEEMSFIEQMNEFYKTYDDGGVKFKKSGELEHAFEAFEEASGVNPESVSGLKLIIGTTLEKMAHGGDGFYPYGSASEVLKIVSPTFSGLRIPILFIYLLTILLLVGIPVSRKMKIPRVITLAGTAGFGLIAFILTCVIRGHRGVLPTFIWSEIRTGTTVFMIILELVIIVAAVLMFLQIFDQKMEKLIPEQSTKPARQKPASIVAESTIQAGGFDSYTGEPISVAVPPMPAPPVEEMTPPPMPVPPMPEPEPVEEMTPPPMPVPPAAEPAETEERRIVAYDPYTGDPIYEGSPLAKALTPPPMPVPPAPEPEPEEEITPPPMPVPPVPKAETKAADEPRMGTVRAIAGVASGQGFRLPETNMIIVGTDSNRATWVINDDNISGEHCSIRYHAAEDTYTVTDSSESGTFDGDTRLEKGVPTILAAGTVLSLADGKNQIKLG